MLLTIYYVAATLMQSWRIRSISRKIKEKLAEKSSIVFYNISNEGNESNTTSELCTNHAQARISDILWLRDNQRGCSLVPLQIIHLGPWVTFPEPPNLIPFEFFNLELDLDPSAKVHLLLETDTVPIEENDDEEIIMIEDYGKLLAWKVDSHFAAILETDVDHFTKLIMSTFMQDNFTINDRLPLIRIESICFEGRPQPFDLLKNHLRKQLISRAMRHLSFNEWEKHLAGLRSLSVLANQAIEFEYNKNRTEGKTGIVKPDLIPSKNIQEDVTVELEQNASSSSLPEQNLTETESSKSSPLKEVDQSQTKTEADEQPLVIEKLPQPVPSPDKGSPNKLTSNSAIQTPSKSQTSPKKITPTDDLDSTKSVTERPEAEIVSVDTVEEKDEKIVPRPIPKASEVASISSNREDTKRPTLVRNKGSLIACKPPNVLVYSDSSSVCENVIATLRDILEQDMYTIYPLSSQQVQQKIWIDNTSLLIVCGSVEPPKSEVLVEYFLQGGKMLSLCSDLLHIIIPTYHTAEVREHELVQFSYDKWQKVKMMHHIFCYQPSPVKKHFSAEGEESVPTLTKKPALVCPRSVEVKDLQGEQHTLDVKVLGTEETWNTPSLLLANNIKSGGKAVFSQVHLEADPTQFETDEIKFSVLKQSDKARLEILSDLLKTHLDILVRKPDDRKVAKDVYKSAYFLGHHETKFELLEKLKSKMESEKLIKLKHLSLKFYGKGEQPPSASKDFIPVSTISCPEDFSTVDYYDNLKTKFIGRLVIYVPLISSTMHVVNELNLTHGMAVIARRQTGGIGRTSNQWLSPEGCAMFALQLHIPLNSVLGQKISLIQHLIAVSVVHSILSVEGYGNLDIRLKWPNDVYANGITKIGGLVVNSQLNQSEAICNIGCALNLNNSNPTICLNDMIKDYNRNNNKNLPLFGYERILALIFTEIERILVRIQKGDLALLYELYYKYWLHGEQEVIIYDKNNQKKPAKIIGIDEFGYLEVQTANGQTESVQPDGNSFDMLRGLILPK